MNKKDIEEKVTNRIIEQLESGVAPWSKPWLSAGLLATSASTGKPYRGINQFLLGLETFLEGYQSPFWATFKQIQALGGRVKKGSSSTSVVFWKLLERDGDDESTTKIPVMRYFNVFNLDQTDGVELPEKLAELERSRFKLEPVKVDEGVELAVKSYVDPPVIEHVPGDRAYYQPSEDVINLPSLKQFEQPEGYASTLFHELVHSTGHESRLNRLDDKARFGCESYAQEELVAEIGAQMLGANVGVDVSIEQSAAYVQSWLKVLQDDRSLIVKAAQQAQKAVDRILGTSFDTEGETK